MEAEMIVVLAMTAAFFGFCVWLQLQSRRGVTNSAQQASSGNTADLKREESEESIEKRSARGRK